MKIQTRRQEIVDILKEEYHDTQSLSKVVGVPVRTLLTDLEHIQHSLKKSLILFEAECEKCGYVFGRRAKLSKPSRCPVCKSERVSGPTLKIEE